MLNLSKTDYIAVGDASRECQVEDADVSLDDFVLARGIQLDGVVVDGDGKPVPGAEIIRLRVSEQPQYQDLKTLAADAKGRFVIRNVGQGTKLKLFARSDVAATKSITEIEVHQDKEVRLVVEPEGTAFITGHVTNADTGDPIPKAEATIAGFEWTDNTGHSRTREAVSCPILMEQTTVSGVLDLQRLQIATRFRRPRGMGRMQVLAAFALVVSLAHADPVTVDGTIVDAGSKPVPNARVWLVRGSPYPWDTAEMLASGRADADGRVVLADVPIKAEPLYWRTSLVAHAEGLTIGWSSVPAQGGAVTVTLHQPARRRVTIATPDGPAAGMRVGLAGIVRQRLAPEVDFAFLSLPPKLTEEYSVQAAEDGSLELLWATADDHLTLRLFTDTEAVIQAYLLGEAPARRITIPPVGTIRGKVVRNGFPGDLAGLEVLALCEAGPAQVMSTHTAVVDATGSFELSAVQGHLVVGLKSSPQDEWQAPRLEQEAFEANKPIDIELQLAQARLVTARVVLEETGEPVPGIAVTFFGIASGLTARYIPTDADGQVRLRALPGRAHVMLSLANTEYVSTDGESRECQVEDQDVTLEEFVIARGLRLEGTVVDGDGEPVPGAEIIRFPIAEQPHYRVIETLTADSRGRFAIPNLAQGKKLKLFARSDVAATKSLIEVEVHQDKPVSLTIEPTGVCFITGTVTNAATGAPIQGARASTIGYEWTGNMGHSRTRESVTTDEDGRFRVGPLLPILKYEVEVTTEGFSRKSVGSLEVTPGQTVDAGQFPLVPAGGFLAGRVVDAQGKPVPDADVYNSCDCPAPVHTRTSAEGEFRLEGLFEGHAYVFAQTDDMFGILYAKTGAEDLLVRLTPDPAATTLSPPDPATPERDFEADKALAAELINEAIDKYGALEGRYAAVFVANLAKLDPDRAMTISAQQGGKFDDRIMRALAMFLVTDALDEALACVESISGEASQAYVLASVAQVVAEQQPERLEEVLELALPTIGCLESPSQRATFLTTIAKATWPVNPDLARPLIEQLSELADALGYAESDARTRMDLAAVVALVDVDRGIEIAEPIAEDYYRRRAIGRIASELAATDPERAVEVLQSLDRWQADEHIPVVAARLTDTDLPRALELCNSAQSPETEVRALGLLAAALADSDPTKACELYVQSMRLASSRLQASQGDGHAANRVASAVAELAYIGRRIGHPGAERILGRALAGLHAGEFVYSVLHTMPLLCALADPPRGREFIRHILQDWDPRHARDHDRLVRRGDSFRAMVIAGGPFAAEVIRALPDPVQGEERPVKLAAYDSVIEALLTPPRARVKQALTTAGLGHLQ